MTTEARAAKQYDKKRSLKVRNRLDKKTKAAFRLLAQIELGKTVVTTEVPTGEIVDGVAETKTVLSLPEPKFRYVNPTRFGWLGAKTYPQQGLSRKNRPGNKELHSKAVVEDASRMFAKEVDRALAPAEATKIPIVPINAVATIGQFADRDPVQGAAIDHSIATGEGLFA